MRIDGTEVNMRNPKVEQYIQGVVRKHGNVALKIVTPSSTYYKYLVKARCLFCDREQYFSKDNVRLHGHSFCSAQCCHNHTQTSRDPKGSNILKNKTSNFYYLLGFLATDGTIVYPAKGTKYKAHLVRLHLQMRDKEILDRIQEAFGGRIKCSGKYVIWELSNEHFLKFLVEEVGFTTKKSRTLDVNKWFETLSSNQQRHFMRGCWDGDGSIHRRGTGYYASNIVSASPPLFGMFCEFFKSYALRVYTEKDPRGNPIYKLCFHGNNMVAPLGLLYENLTDSDLVLDRKKRVFLEYKNTLA